MLSRSKRRLEKELEQIKKDHKDLRVVVPDDEILNWRVIFQGPSDSIYSGEEFVLSFTFEPTYVYHIQPMESPEVVFIGKPPAHEHIYSNGFICLSSLHSGWRPSMTVASTVLSICSMLSSATNKKKPKDDKEVVKTTRGQRSKDQEWNFHDDKC